MYLAFSSPKGVTSTRLQLSQVLRRISPSSLLSPGEKFRLPRLLVDGRTTEADQDLPFRHQDRLRLRHGGRLPVEPVDLGPTRRGLGLGPQHGHCNLRNEPTLTDLFTSLADESLLFPLY